MDRRRFGWRRTQARVGEILCFCSGKAQPAEKTANADVLRCLLIAAALLAWFMCRAHADTARVEIVVSDLLFPEGTIFVGEDLYFVDYVRSSVLRLRDPRQASAKPEVVWHRDGCGANGLVAVPSGLWVACFDGGTMVEISLDGATLQTIRQDALGRPLTAPNDFAADTKGGVYISDSGSSSRPGKVFYLGRDRPLREVASGIRFANGIGVSPDGATLYVAESPTGKVHRHDCRFPWIDPDWSSGARRFEQAGRAGGFHNDDLRPSFAEEDREVTC